MKIFYNLVVLLFLTAMPVLAQDQPSGDGHQPPSADEIVAMMQSKLNLTQDQVTAITPIIEKYSSKREEIRQSMEDGTADRDSLRSQMKELKTDEGQELAQVLSAGQMSQWKSMMRTHKHNKDSESPSRGDDGSGNRD